MAYNIEVRGWVEWDDQGNLPWRGAFHDVPDETAIRDIVSDPGEVEGLWIRAYDPDTGAEHYYWLWTYFSLDWDQWDMLIDGSAEMHGFALA